MSNSNFITLHAIHAVPASLLNRDDSNAAKRINFGGTNRLRVSSQSWKRAIRVNMRENAIDGGAYGIRTRRFPQLVAEQLVSDHGRELDVATAKAAAVFTALKLKATDKGTTAASIFASETLPTHLAAAIDAHWDAITDNVEGGTDEAEEEANAPEADAKTTKKSAKQKKSQVVVPAEVIAAAHAALDVDNTIDLALMGRMQAEIPAGGRIDGAVGVSHAFSVDPLAVEADFFTAVDDATPDGDAVSGNLGTVDLAAPVLYRTATLDRRQLRRNLAAATNTEELAVAAEASFIDWFIRAVPSAKQRSTVAATLPALVAATAGPQIISAADAFASAVVSDDVVSDATTRLVKALDRQKQFVPGVRIERLALGVTLPSEATADAHDNTDAFIRAVAAA